MPMAMNEADIAAEPPASCVLLTISFSITSASAPGAVLYFRLNVTFFVFISLSIFISHGSSIFITAVPLLFILQKSSPFSDATPSILPSVSMCDSPIFVRTATSGLHISASLFISPFLLMPSSTTAASWILLRLKSVRGRPMRLFRLPSVFTIQRDTFNMDAIISFVVVFPQLPLTAISGTGCIFRQ